MPRYMVAVALATGLTGLVYPRIGRADLPQIDREKSFLCLTDGQERNSASRVASASGPDGAVYVVGHSALTGEDGDHPFAARYAGLARSWKMRSSQAQLSGRRERQQRRLRRPICGGQARIGAKENKRRFAGDGRRRPTGVRSRGATGAWGGGCGGPRWGR